MNFVLLTRNERQLEIHQPVVSHVSNKIRTTTDGESHTRRSGQGDLFRACACRGIEEVNDRRPYFVAPISVGSQIDLCLAMLDYTRFQDFGLRLRCASQQRPVRSTRQGSL